MRLPRSFYARDAETVARELVGKTLCVAPAGTPRASDPSTHGPAGRFRARRPQDRASGAGDGGAGPVRARVTETEAYVGPHDLACHASKGLTPRTRVIHGPPGHAYVYFVYGMHHMLNVVTGPDGHGEAVLVRAAEPLGFDARLDGPGRLTKALGITVQQDNGIDLMSGRIWFEEGPRPPLAVTPRIGIDYAGPWAAAPLRFLDAESPHVSRRAPR